MLSLIKLVTNSLFLNEGPKMQYGCQSCPMISDFMIVAVASSTIWGNLYCHYHAKIYTWSPLCFFFYEKYWCKRRNVMVMRSLPDIFTTSAKGNCDTSKIGIYITEVLFITALWYLTSRYMFKKPPKTTKLLRKRLPFYKASAKSKIRLRIFPQKCLIPYQAVFLCWTIHVFLQLTLWK